MSDLKKLYINYKNPIFKNIPSQMFFSKEWIKNVAKLSEKIQNIDTLYLLYGDLEMISGVIKLKNELLSINALDDYNTENQDKLIKRLAEKVFNITFINSNMEQYSDEVDLSMDDLNETYKDILNNLRTQMN
jgi:GTPase involved in cell partitioning and DNA repair